MTWFYAKYDMKKFEPVESVAILDHIEDLQRHMKETLKEVA